MPYSRALTWLMQPKQLHTSTAQRSTVMPNVPFLLCPTSMSQLLQVLLNMLQRDSLAVLLRCNILSSSAYLSSSCNSCYL